MYVDEIIAIHDKIAQASDLKTEKHAEIKAARVAVAEATGYKATIARSRLADAEKAVADIDATLDLMKASLPSCPSGQPIVWFASRYADYMRQRLVLEGKAGEAEKQLAAALEEAKKGAWKRKGADMKETIPVAAARKQVEDITAKIAELDRCYQSTKTIIDDERRVERETNALDAWVHGSGPMPDFIRQRQKQEEAALMKGCVSLKLPIKTITMKIREEVEEPAEWTSNTSPEPSKSPEPEPLTPHIDDVFPGIGCTSVWIARFMAEKKARASQTHV